jgi:uncharacterized protein YbaR (Trm112 family)/SAM-dependent methyltransferase
MHASLLELLRCPFCGTRCALVTNAALEVLDDRIESAVLGCECCAFPVVAGIPVLIANDATRDAMHALESGERETALLTLLGVDDARREWFRAFVARGKHATYREGLDILSHDAEGTCFLYRFSDPTFLTTESLFRAIGQQASATSGRCLDICGGTGHLTRVLAGLRPADATILADLYFWKLWLATRFMVPGCEPVCCDANAPLPFARESFSLVTLSDAFPYIWHKRLLAEEMMRVTTAEGVIVMPHLHNALGENFSAGNTLTPSAYRDLFAPLRPRLFSDKRLFSNAIDRGVVDLGDDRSPSDLGNEASLTLVASHRADLFRCYEVPDMQPVSGELTVNPLYRVDRQGGSSILTLTFPTPEYEEEFGECRRYLPETVKVDADLAGAIDPATLGSRYEELRRRRVVIDAPPRYC